MSDNQIPLTENGLHLVNGVWWMVQPRGVVQNAVGLPPSSSPFKRTTIKRSNFMPQYDLSSTQHIPAEVEQLENMIKRSPLRKLMATLPQGQPRIMSVEGLHSRAVANLHRTHNQGNLNLFHIDALTKDLLSRTVQNLELSNMTTVTLLGIKNHHRVKLENFMRQVSWKNRQINLQFDEDFATSFDRERIEITPNDERNLRYLGGNIQESHLKMVGARHLKNLMRGNHVLL